MLMVNKHERRCQNEQLPGSVCSELLGEEPYVLAGEFPTKRFDPCAGLGRELCEFARLK